MNNTTFKGIWPFVILILLCIPIATSSILDLEQKKADKLVLEQERIQKEAEEKIQKKIYLMGKFEPSEKEDFALIPAEYTTNKNKMYLRKETLDAFSEMQAKANEDGISLKIASATRNFIYQKNLWNNKWTGYTLVDSKDLSKNIPDGLERFKKILEYSAAPGTSRHHFGTDIDINDANPEYFQTKQGQEVYEWLTKNASQFGFCQPYNLKGSARPSGYNEEKWHWSYLPLAITFTQDYKNLIKDEDIDGFLGEEYVSNLNLINDYVLGINPDCI